MISDRKLKLITITCLIIMSVCLGYAWYVIEKQNLPTAFGFCLIGVMASLYFIGLTFDRYRRALYAEAMRLYKEEHVRAEDLAARIHVRDITIRLQTEDLERHQAANKQNAAFKSDINRRIELIVNNLNNAIAAVTPTNKTE